MKEYSDFQDLFTLEWHYEGLQYIEVIYFIIRLVCIFLKPVSGMYLVG